MLKEGQAARRELQVAHLPKSQKPARMYGGLLLSIHLSFRLLIDGKMDASATWKEL